MAPRKVFTSRPRVYGDGQGRLYQTDAQGGLTPLTGTVSGDVVRWNGTNFELGTGSTVGDLDDLSDVTITGVASGDALIYNGTTWVNAEPTAVLVLDDLTDVATTGLASGDWLRYNGTTWVPVTAAALSDTIVLALDDLTDVAAAGAVSGDQLYYTGSGWALRATEELSGMVSGDVMYYDGADWTHPLFVDLLAEALPDVDVGSTITLDDLSDVDAAGAVSGDQLYYTGSGWALRAMEELSGMVSGDVLYYDGVDWIHPPLVDLIDALDVGGSIAVDEGGVEVVAAATRINFSGDVQVTDDGAGAVTVEIGNGAILDGITAFVFPFGDGTVAEQNGAKRRIPVPYGFRITDWLIVADASCSATFTVEARPYGGTATDLVGAGTDPSVASGTEATDTASGWDTTTVAANSELIVTLSSYTAGLSRHVALTVKVTKLAGNNGTPTTVAVDYDGAEVSAAAARLVFSGSAIESVTAPESGVVQVTIAGGIDPTTYTNCDLALLSDGTMTKDGSDIVSLIGESTGTLGQFTTNTGRGPLWVDNVYRGHPVLRFNGTSQYLYFKRGTAHTGQSFSFLMLVARRGDGTGYDNHLSLFKAGVYNDNTTTQGGIPAYWSNGATVVWPYRASGSRGTQYTIGGFSAKHFFLIGEVYDGSEWMQLSRDGVISGVNTDASLTGAFDVDTIVVAGRQDGSTDHAAGNHPAHFANMDLVALLVKFGAWSHDDIDANMKFLSGRFDYPINR
jgi:hypothetical protein